MDEALARTLFRRCFFIFLFKESIEVFFTEWFDATFGYPFEEDAADLYAHEFFDEVVLRFEEASNFAFFTVVEVDFEAAQMVVSNRGCGDDFLGFEEFSIAFNAVEQNGDVCLIEFTVEEHTVAFDDTPGRVGQLMGEVAVVGQDEQALAVFVESTGAEHPLPLKIGWEQVEDGAIGVWIGIGAEEALGLIHGHGQGRYLGDVEPFVFYKYVVFGKCFVAEADGFAVDPNGSVIDQALGFAA